MTGVIATLPRYQFSNALGVPLVGGKLYTYLAGTTKPVATYQDQDLTILNENPIPLDATGSATIWLDPTKQYKFVLKSALGVTQPGWPIDNVSGAATALSLAPTLSSFAKLSVLAAAVGAALIGFIQMGIGAAPITVLDKLRALETSAIDYAIVADGTSQTAKFQKAIDAVSAAGGGLIKLAPGLTYVVGGLIPRPGVLIDLNGSTLKLADNSNTPVFFDGGAGNGNRFGVVNGVLDCNQANNKGINVVGGIWLTGWSNLDFRRLVVKNCYRIGLNLINCNWFSVRDYRFEDSGILDGSSYFAYALNIEGTSRYFDVRNVVLSNVIGYGVHFFGCSDFTAEDLSFYNMTYVKGTAKSIAITFTQASRFATANVIANQVAGDSIEINSCSDGTFTNYNIQQSGGRALLIGVNGAGANSARLRFNNFQTLATGDAFAASLSYLENCEFNEMSLDKPVSYNVASTTSKNNIIRNSDIASTAAASVGLINKGYFILENVRFTDWTYRHLNRQRVNVSTKQRIAAAAALDISFPSVIPGLLTTDGAVAGTLTTLTRFTGSFDQGALQTCQFLVNDAGTAANLSAITQVNSNVPRALTITGTAAGKKITLTNGTAVDLDVSINLDMAVFS